MTTVTKDVNINVHYLTRVEGHANILVNTKKGVIDELKLEIIEAPRFFEAMVWGKSYYDLAQITCRICGICAVGHTLASLRGHRGRPGHRPQRADRAAAQADPGCRDHPEPRAPRLLPGGAGLLRRGLGDAPGHQPPRRGAAGPAAEEAGQRHVRGHRRAAGAPHQPGARRLHPRAHGRRAGRPEAADPGGRARPGGHRGPVQDAARSPISTIPRSTWP